MNFTIIFSWWMVPTSITIITLLWAFFWPISDKGLLGCRDRVILAPIITLLIWVIVFIFK